MNLLFKRRSRSYGDASLKFSNDGVSYEVDLELEMEYRQLDRHRGEVRLLKILDAGSSSHETGGNATEASNPVDLGLKHFPLRDHRPEKLRDLPGQFIALSYTWGDPDDLDQVSVDGVAVVVRSHLKKALGALRTNPLIQAGCSIWTDALCIDQKNMAEISYEVGRMGDIYRQAFRVVVWLGDAADGSDLAKDFVNELDRAGAHSGTACQNVIRHFLATDGQTIWSAMCKLMSRDYWDRLWIVQEITLGGPQSIIMCGSRSTTWEKLYRVYNSTYLHKHSYVAPEMHSIFQTVWENSPIQI